MHSIKESSFRGKNSRLCIFSGPKLTLFSHLPLCQYSFLPLWKPLQGFPFQSISDAFLFLIWSYKPYPTHLQMSSRSLKPENLRILAHWSIPTEQHSEEQGLQNHKGEMPSNAPVSLTRELSYCSDVTSSSRRKKRCVWTFTIRRFMPVLWLIQIKLKIL